MSKSSGDSPKPRQPDGAKRWRTDFLITLNAALQEIESFIGDKSEAAAVFSEGSNDTDICKLASLYETMVDALLRNARRWQDMPKEMRSHIETLWPTFNQMVTERLAKSAENKGIDATPIIRFGQADNLSNLNLAMIAVKALRVKSQSVQKDNVSGTPAGSQPSEPAQVEPLQPPALNECQRLTLTTMASFDPSDLVSARRVADAMDPMERLSPRTVTPAIRQLVKLQLAERPHGSRQGARLTIQGRKIASKIAD